MGYALVGTTGDGEEICGSLVLLYEKILMVRLSRKHGNDTIHLRPDKFLPISLALPRAFATAS